MRGATVGVGWLPSALSDRLRGSEAARIAPIGRHESPRPRVRSSARSGLTAGVSTAEHRPADGPAEDELAARGRSRTSIKEGFACCEPVAWFHLACRLASLSSIAETSRGDAPCRQRATPPAGSRTPDTNPGTCGVSAALVASRLTYEEFLAAAAAQPRRVAGARLTLPGLVVRATVFVMTRPRNTSRLQAVHDRLLEARAGSFGRGLVQRSLKWLRGVRPCRNLRRVDEPTSRTEMNVETASRWKGCTAAAATVLAVAAALTWVDAAAAYDDAPCGPVTRGAYVWDVQYCPLWRDNVPVRRSPDPNSRVVGYLWNGGWRNWFFCEAAGRPQYLGRLVNAWWAATVADGNAERGWVSEVYFSGGLNWEPDRGLRNCHDLIPAPTIPQ